MNSKIKLGILDDDLLIVSLLKSFFAIQENLEIVYDHTDGLDFIDKLENLELDILLLDLKMKNIDGLEVLEHINKSVKNIKVIVVSSHYQDNTIGFMFKKGVSAFLPKGISPLDLIQIIKTVSETGYYFTDIQVDFLRNQISKKAPKVILDEELDLTEREIEIIKLICQQKTAKEIGEILFITQRTVEGHKNNLFSKIGVKNITGLVVFALQKKIINLEELSIN